MDGSGARRKEIMNQGCCGGGAVRLIRIGDTKVGLTGLDAILERFYLEGWSPGDTGLEAALVEACREAGNYILPPEGPAYAAALGELYRQFCAVNAASGEQHD